MKTSRVVRRRSDRRGSTLIVVIALLGALLLLGMLVLTVASQEEVNAEYFAAAAKDPQEDLDPDIYFDFALRQIIIGPDPIAEKQSALDGGHLSLLANMMGYDMAPYSGRGITLRWNSTSGLPEPDSLFHATDVADLLDPNRSAACRGDFVDQSVYPEPDVDYTRPDINSMFISYDGMALPTPGLGGTQTPVSIASYFRPQYLRNIAPAAQWYTNNATARRVLRPHHDHRCVRPDGTVTPNVKRFVRAGEEGALTLSKPFPFGLGGTDDPVQKFGLWSGDGSTYELDADPAGTGIKDSIYVDLGFAGQPASGGGFYVPIFSIKLIDVDALLNVNAVGNPSGAASTLSQDPVGGWRVTAAGTDTIVGTPDDTTGSQVEFISRSNKGIGPHEINPQWLLNANPPASGDPSIKTHETFFNHAPGSAIELSNMEWWFLLMGSAEYGTSAAQILDLHLGRLGDGNSLVAGLQSSLDPTVFPRPGSPNVDDNGNLEEGTGAYHPLDLKGNGQFVTRGTTGKTRNMFGLGQHQWARYDNYYMHPNTVYRLLGVADTSLQGLIPLYSQGKQLDDAYETKLEPAMAQFDGSDAIFTAQDLVALFLGNNDRATTGISGRVETLAPVNLKTDTNAEYRRRALTTDSWDFRAYSKSRYSLSLNSARSWEFNADYNQDGNLEFPPKFPNATTANDPFRSELRDYLTIDAGERNFKKPQGRLSVNHVLERGTDGRLRFRPLWPHPLSGLGNSPVRSVSSRPSRPEQISTPADQEWVARRDRQLLCRDLYVLLYTVCGGNDARNYTSDNSTQILYSTDPNDASTNGDGTRGDQCRQMAQFVVNLVDQLDVDDVMTVFEYDTNLADGWGLGDDPYSTADDDPTQASQRKTVVGIEEAQLVLNEALAVVAKRVKLAGLGTNIDDTITQWKDDENRDWMWFELENVSPRQVNFSNEAWQVVVRPPLTDPTVPLPSGKVVKGKERRLTLLAGNSALPVGNGSLMSIGTQGDTTNKTGTTVNPSFFRVNPHKGEASDPSAVQTIIPRSGSLTLDLVTGNSGLYRVSDAGGSGEVGEGTTIGNTPDPAGTDLFHLELTDPDDISEMDDGFIKIEVEIRRRANPYRTHPDAQPSTNHETQSVDNPWVVVDRMSVPLDIFTLPDDTPNPVASNIRPQLNTIATAERTDPLNGIYTGTGFSGAGGPRTFTVVGSSGPDDNNQYILNSIGQKNLLGSTTPPTKFDLWHPRFDRDFSSVAELFQIPLYGPEELTRRLKFHGANQEPAFPAFNITTGDPFASNWEANMTAGYRFLHPHSRLTGATANNDNRWYRLLDFVEVPNRWHRHINNPVYNIDAGLVGGSPLGIYRNPGKLQLNMLRHPEVLAGLIDDQDVCVLNANWRTTGVDYLKDVAGTSFGETRDWWVQFLLARDGADPLNPGLIVPGLPPNYGEDANRDGRFDLGEDTLTVNGVLDPNPRQGGRPFRSAQYALNGYGSLEDTIYRSLPGDLQGNYSDPRGLFEIGSRSGAGVRDNVDPTLKNRILEKLANNSSIRSNVFVAFIQVDFFEAAEVDDESGTGGKVYRVGGKRADSPGYRGIFVIDRSKAYELLQPNDLPRYYDHDNDNGSTTPSRLSYSFNQQFDFRSLILHRQTIR